MRFKLLPLMIAASAACTSTYHPEYHPVTVTTVHQAWSGAPVTVTPVATSGTGVVHAGVMPLQPPVVVTGQPQPIVIQEPTLADPEVVFRR